MDIEFTGRGFDDALAQVSGLTPDELALFALYWDDDESGRSNIDTIAWWLRAADKAPAE